MKTVLFVCIENACRSQMAEGFAKMIGAETIEPYSSGSRPSGKVNEKAIASMKAVGYNMDNHFSKGFDDIPQIEFDTVVTMGCGDVCPNIPTKQKEDWDIPDPKQMDMEQFGKIRDLIRLKVNELIEGS